MPINGRRSSKFVSEFNCDLLQNLITQLTDGALVVREGIVECYFILIEAKGYGATGSKMSDIIDDVDAIIGAKRHDASLLLITDGLTWKARANDLRKLIRRQNDGRITRIYTKQIQDQFRNDLETLKAEYGL
mgnify:CR=1 FL=1